MGYYYLCKHILTKLWDNPSPPFSLSPHSRKYISNRSIASCWDNLNATYIVLPVDLQMCFASTDGFQEVSQIQAVWIWPGVSFPT